MHPDLVKKAGKLSESQKYIESAEAYARLNRLNKESWSRVAQLENLRMAGALTRDRFKHSDSIQKFRETLGGEATHLVVEYLNSITSNAKLKKIVAEEKFCHIKELEILAKKLLNLQDSKSKLSNLNFKQGKLDLMHYISVAILRRRNLIYIPKMKVLNAKSPKPAVAIIRKHKTLFLQDAIFTSSSEAIKYGQNWIVDAATFPQATKDNYTCDSLLLGRVRSKVALRFDVTPYRTLNSVIFLAYPLTSSWGHWVIEVLTRIAQLAQRTDLSDFELIICDDVPENFLEVTYQIFGKLNFTRIPNGQSIHARNSIVSLATHHQKKRFFASREGGKRAYLDWRSFKLLGEITAAKDFSQGETHNQFNPNVYLDRTNSKYRKSESVSKLREAIQDIKFTAIDPGTMSAAQEMRLFAQTQEVVGFYGSQMLLLFASRNLKKAVFVYHDQLDEARCFSQMIKKVTGISPIWVSGSRSNVTKTYSEHSIHQGISLAPEQLRLVREAILAPSINIT